MTSVRSYVCHGAACFGSTSPCSRRFWALLSSATGSLISGSCTRRIERICSGYSGSRWSQPATRSRSSSRRLKSQLGWMTHLSWVPPALEQRELDGRRLLRQVPAITELMLLDPQGRERIHLSRQAEDSVDNKDASSEEAFKTAIAGQTYYGPVYFRRQTEPYMKLAVGGARRVNGVSVAEINLKHIWDVVTQIKVGQAGRAYVVGPDGRLIAHPDISMVLRNTDLSQLPQVKAARATPAEPVPSSRSALDLYGKRMLTAHTVVKPLNWLVFVELPENEANGPLHEAIARWLVVTILGLALALVPALLLARHMVVPIRAIADGAERIGTGALDHRIKIRTEDELEALAEQFNRMASQLQGSYGSLERKVEERTQQLRDANMAKSRFLAVASHDLRQPLHALNLFIAQLDSESDPAEHARLKQRILSSIDSMNKLFNELLDISRLDAGALTPRITAFAVNDVLTRISATFLAARPGEGLAFSRGTKLGLGEERSHSPGAHPPQSRFKRHSLYEHRRRHRRVPSPARQLAHRHLRHRRWHCRGSAAKYFHRVLPDPAGRARERRGAGTRLGDRRSVVLAAAASLRAIVDPRQGLALLRHAAPGCRGRRGPRGVSYGTCARRRSRGKARRRHRRRSAGAGRNARIVDRMGVPRCYRAVARGGEIAPEWRGTRPHHLRPPPVRRRDGRRGD